MILFNSRKPLTYITCTLQSFPTVYAFLIYMNQESYYALLNVVRNILPLRYEHLCVITDFEIPLMNSVQNVMTDSKFYIV